jgi:hypothetical protein
MGAPTANDNAAKPAGEKATSFLHIRAVPKERAKWDKAAVRAGVKLARWARQTLNRAA